MGTGVRTVEIAAGAEFGQVETGRRRISGLIIEWGVVASSGGRRYRFARDSLTWADPSRVKLNRDHDRGQAVGVAERLVSTSRGLMAEFRIARTSEGDETLTLAEDRILDGFSIEADDLDTEPDPEDRRVLLVRRGRLIGVALTGWPAFDEARVDQVAASRDSRFELRMDSDLLERLRQHAEADGTSISESARAGISQFVSRPGSGAYTFDGRGPSLLADIRDRVSDPEAAHRLEAFGKAQRAGQTSQFTMVTTADNSQVVPPGFRPDVEYTPTSAPLVDMARRVPIADPTPFVIPGAAAVSGSAQTGTEGTPVGDATLALSGVSVTPRSVVGRVPLSRELLDGSSPAADLVAIAAARVDYMAELERRVFAVLNGTGGQGGVITGGKVPSGASVYSAATATDAPTSLREAAARFVHRAGAGPLGVAVSEEFAVAIDDLDVTRPFLRSLPINGSPAMTDAAATDGDALLLAPGTVWLWTSPRAELRYGEKQGPEIIELALFGYAAVAVVRPPGLASIRLA